MAHVRSIFSEQSNWLGMDMSKPGTKLKTLFETTSRQPNLKSTGVKWLEWNWLMVSICFNPLTNTRHCGSSSQIRAEQTLFWNHQPNKHPASLFESQCVSFFFGPWCSGWNCEHFRGLQRIVAAKNGLNFYISSHFKIFFFLDMLGRKIESHTMVTKRSSNSSLLFWSRGCWTSGTCDLMHT